MKKGFTLIELLAVILISGIIALIAIPTVNNILKEARRGAFSSTLNNLEKAIEEKCTLEQIKNQVITTSYSITDGVISPSLDIKGDLPDGTITVNSNCEVSFTLSDNNFTGTKDFVGEITITDGSTDTGVVYKEAILNGTDPVLNNGLIPVTIANYGTVKKADTSTKWYSYAEKKWANAVILKDSGKIESNGTIKEESIRAYFVWIPRYKYKIFNMGNYANGIDGSYLSGNSYEEHATEIEIIFENKNTSISIGEEVGQYHSHPAFQAFDANGFWTSKFEMTGSIDYAESKPLQMPIDSVNFKTLFDTAFNFNRDMESHMMKNTEWGAVAYLSHSRYGINKEINVNNSCEYTGYSSTLPINQSIFPEGFEAGTDEMLPYNTEIGYLASTTGNITGIYDMSGGSYEFVAAYNAANSDHVASGSGFESDPSTIYGDKYFDKYYGSEHSDRILGDATGELGPFYNIHIAMSAYYTAGWYRNRLASMGESNVNLYMRGGICGYEASGQFSANTNSGHAYSNQATRIVLAG
jgi:type IV pilus assembly protein PilA